MWEDQQDDCMAGSMVGEEEVGEVREVGRGPPQHRAGEILFYDGRLLEG